MSEKKTVLVTIPVKDSHKTYLEEQARGGAFETSFRYMEGSAVTAEDVAEASALIGNLPPALIKQAGKLEWFQLNSAGANQYTVPGILKEDTVLTCASGAYGTAVGEHMLAMTFAMIRHFEQYARSQTRHSWENHGDIISVEGAVIAVLGLGDIGGFYAKAVKALGAYVIGVRRTEKEKPDYLDEQVTIDHLDEILPRADIVAMVLPGGEMTDHLMDERRLRLMKKGSYIINVGRGSAIEPDALKKVLKDGHLGGAALDVTEPEPLPAEDELWDMDNVLITPHVAGWYFLPVTFERIVKIAGTNLHAWTHGGEFIRVVDRRFGY